MHPGFLLIDKPAGVTSHDVVDAVRKQTGERCVGHAGTLDPFATGLLIVGVGREATKKLSEFLHLDKEYVATALLGATSTTDDSDGVITPCDGALAPSHGVIETTLTSFLGTHEQIVPAYAAKKVNGMKLYEYARKGLPVPRVTTSVTIHEVELLSYEWPILSFRTRVSSGTYIRALARDLGEKLTTGAYLTALRRTKIGTFDIKDAERIEIKKRPKRGAQD